MILSPASNPPNCAPCETALPSKPLISADNPLAAKQIAYCWHAPSTGPTCQRPQSTGLPGNPPQPSSPGSPDRPTTTGPGVRLFSPSDQSTLTRLILPGPISSG